MASSEYLEWLVRRCPIGFKQHVVRLPMLVETLLPMQADDVLELDEIWSFVGKKEQKRWGWIVLCRRTRQIVAFFIGQRNSARCQQLWQRVPIEYSQRACVSDAWQTYPEVIPSDLHTIVDKASSETAYVRQLCGEMIKRSSSDTTKTGKTLPDA